MRLPVRNRLAVSALRALWILTILWFEFGTFYYVVGRCSWPDVDVVAGPKDSAKHVLIVADPQILDHRSYPGRSALLTFLSRLFTDLNLRKSWRAVATKKPDAVVFLGDMMDGGRLEMSDSEYEDYFRRFMHIFGLNADMPAYFIPGNHDTGLGISATFSHDARARYISHFGPLNSQFSIANHTLVLLDAPTLVEEDYRRNGRGQSFDDWKAAPDGPIQFVKSFSAGQHMQPVILFSHIPMSRPDGSNCGPLRERGTIRRGVGLGYQNTLGKQTSTFLMDSFRPTLIFSGDDHDYCDYHHEFRLDGKLRHVKEVTVKSFSMAMGVRRPGFQLLSLVPPNEVSRSSHANKPCLLPDQIGIYLNIYIPLIVLSLLLLLVVNLSRTRRLPPWMTSRPSITTNQNFHVGRASSPFFKTLRSRFDVDKDKDFAYQSDRNNLSLPLPTSSNLGRRRHIKWQYACCSLAAPLRVGASKQRGFISGFLRDIRDVAIFPLSIFMIVAWIFS
ncbi:Metallo-dependent phosphatase [Guyanagaster necrorhizus]|uniref:Metallo-dependent phosphatase n=1 Tax=Guyanagaster necrorhizus TaxID=856835 RepID=A0A9P8AST0_9AGAR|nr:Metallo-dependent phosphatase [Guyanagaster necrorhizus MCA 3950]KAG7446241.1 Metallo-dependent phosphatase [Guyanagaster necrorhizus MCA 3950]